MWVPSVLSLALRVLHAVGSQVSTARQQGDAGVPLTVDDGAVLDDPEFGGQDLLVTMARVVAGTGAATESVREGVA